MDRTAYSLARSQGQDVSEADDTEDLELRMTAVPSLAHLPPRDYRRLMIEMVREIEEETLRLLPIKTRATIQIFRALLDTIEEFGLPKQIRTDNEACFTSKLKQCALSMLGIQHQRIDRCTPWQNGRIERFFGTLKSKTKRWQARNGSQPEDPDAQLQCFRFWYNQVRPHQHLGGRTPGEIWNGSERKRNDQSVYFSAWDDLLTGFFVPK